MNLTRRVLGLVMIAIVAMPVVSHAQTERGAISGLVTDETKAALPGRLGQGHQHRHQRDHQRRLVRLRHLQRRQPPAGHLSHRGLAAGLPHVDRRGHQTHRGRDRAHRRDAEPRGDLRVGERGGQEHPGADRRRKDLHQHLEPIDRPAPARGRRRDAQCVRPRCDRARSQGQRHERGRSAAGRAERSAPRSTASRSTPTATPTPPKPRS